MIRPRQKYKQNSRLPKSVRRRADGQQIAEFTAALVLLVLVFFIPLLDFGILPIRYFMAQELVAGYARRLSHCETLTQAYAEMNADPSLRARLMKIGGIQPKNLELHLVITTIRGYPLKKIEVIKPKTVPQEWWPEGRNSPCEYILELVAPCDISPAISMTFEPKVMGLSKPVPFILHADSPWENLGRNPITKMFFVNE